MALTASDKEARSHVYIAKEYAPACLAKTAVVTYALLRSTHPPAWLRPPLSAERMKTVLLYLNTQSYTPG